jgi:hypothetical protein
MESLCMNSVSLCTSVNVIHMTLIGKECRCNFKVWIILCVQLQDVPQIKSQNYKKIFKLRSHQLL